MQWVNCGHLYAALFPEKVYHKDLWLNNLWIFLPVSLDTGDPNQNIMKCMSYRSRIVINDDIIVSYRECKSDSLNSEPATLIVRLLEACRSVELFVFNSNATLSKNDCDSSVTTQQSLEWSSFWNSKMPNFRIADNIRHMTCFWPFEKTKRAQSSINVIKLYWFISVMLHSTTIFIRQILKSQKNLEL